MIYYLAQVFKEYRIVSDEGTRTVLGTYVYIIYNSVFLAQGKPKNQTQAWYSVSQIIWDYVLP